MSELSEIPQSPEYRGTMERLEGIKNTLPTGVDYWLARDIYPILGYANWDGFAPAVKRAIDACEGVGARPSHHFRRTSAMMKVGKGGTRAGVDYFLSRTACYLIAMNGDPSKPEVAAAQAYFAVQTRRMEIEDRSAEDRRRVGLRKRIKDGNKSLNDAAKAVGVERFGIFHDAGYRGLYGMGLEQLRKYKGIGNAHPLDHADFEELAANAFRISQTESKLKREEVKGEAVAIQTHQKVAEKIRRTIQDLGGTMPENMRVAPSIKEVEKRLARQSAPPLIKKP